VAARVNAVDASSAVTLITDAANTVVLRPVLVATSLLGLITTTVVEVVLEINGVDGYEVGVARPGDELEVVGDGEVSNAIPSGVDSAQQVDGRMIQLPYLQ